MNLQIVRSISDLRSIVSDWKRQGHSVGCVPTMGALHEGHLSLVNQSRTYYARVITSIFVNPKQFGASEDLNFYPRPELQDIELLKKVQCDLLYAPPLQEMYPEGFKTVISQPDQSEILCGASRPGHFDGVLTVVCKLLQQIQPDGAFFGEKDYQQLFLIRRMVADLNIPVTIHSGAIVRDRHGLALSSRNAYLSVDQLKKARKLNIILFDLKKRLESGGPAPSLISKNIEILADAGFDSVDYLEIRDAKTLDPCKMPLEREARILVAARLGKTRLIDNFSVMPGHTL